MTHGYQGCLENVSALMALVLNEGSTLAGSRQPAQRCLKLSVEAKAGAGKPKRKSAKRRADQRSVNKVNVDRSTVQQVLNSASAICACMLVSHNDTDKSGPAAVIRSRNIPASMCGGSSSGR